MNDVIESNSEDWDLVIEPKSNIFRLNVKEIWNYRYLLVMFVKRDLVSVYKQTILGPLWFFIQPILTTITFVVIFGNIAQISTDGLPQILFYLAGITVWNYFSETLNSISNIFTLNASIFGKVYFPRVILPLSKVVSGFLKFLIQYLLFALTLVYFVLKGSQVHPNIIGIIFITPLILIIMAGLSFGLGLILSSLTTKYRDLTFLVTFGIQLGMYATPIIYPMSALHSKYKALILANPMSSLVEAFRTIYLGSGKLDFHGLIYSFCFAVIIIFLGVMIFNKVEKSFMDTV